MMRNLRNLLNQASVPSRVLGVLIAGFFVLRIPMLLAQSFNPDEFQHLHATFNVSQGLLPYRDFFEHHTPLFYWVLAPLYAVFGAAVPVLFAARALMLIFTAGVLVLTYRLARRLYGAEVALMAVVFLSSMRMFVLETLEVRPDTLETLFWLLSLLSFMRGLTRRSRRWQLFSGSMLGIASLFSQKALFALPMLLLVVLWSRLDRRLEITFRQALGATILFGLGMSIPMLAAAGYFLANGALWEFVNLNFLFNLRYAFRFEPWGYLLQSLRQNPFFWVLGLAGLVIAAIRLRRPSGVRRAAFVPVFATFVLLGGVFLIPVPYREYYVKVLPLLAIYCAVTVREGARYLAGLVVKARSSAPLPSWLSIRRLAAPVVLIAQGSVLMVSQPPLFGQKAVYLLWWAVILGLVVAAARRNKPALIALLLVIGIVVEPLYRMVSDLKIENAQQLADIRFVASVTAPHDTVLDGWTGAGVFRPQAYYYGFLNSEMQIMLDQSELANDLIQALAARRTPLVVYDDAIRALPSQVQTYLQTHYAPSGHGDIYLLRDR